MDSSRHPLIAATLRLGELLLPFFVYGGSDGWSFRFVGVVGRFLDFVEEMMVRALFCLVLFFLGPVSAYATSDYPATIVWYMYGSAKRDSDVGTACTLNTPVPANGNTYSLYLGDPNKYYVCRLTWSTGATSDNQMYYLPSGVCPYGGTFTITPSNGDRKQGTTYTCVGGTPPPSNCTDTNPFIRKFYYVSGPFIGPSNYAGCQVVALELLVCRTDSTGLYCMWKVQRNGQVYSGPDVQNGGKAGDSPEVKTDPPNKSPPLPGSDPKACPTCVPCPAGTVQAGLDKDSIPICIGTGTQPQNPTPAPPTTTKPATTTTNSDGSTVTTQQTVQQNSDGSSTTTTTTTTTAADGSKTVSMGSSTTNNTAGTAGRQDTPNTDQMNLCKQNPMLSICSNSSVAGDCTTGVTCTGDAIQCATLQAAKKLQCARQADEDGLKSSPTKTLGDSILGGTDPSKGDIDALIKGDTADMSNPALDQGGFVGGGSCLPDKTFTVMGHAVTVSFATVCSNVQPLRYIVMACAFILVYLMVARSVING